MLATKPYQTQAVGKRFARKAGQDRYTKGQSSTNDRQGKVGSYTTDRSFYSVAGVNKTKVAGTARRGSSNPGGTDIRGSAKSSPRDVPNVAGVNQFPGLKARGAMSNVGGIRTASKSVANVNRRGEQFSPAKSTVKVVGGSRSIGRGRREDAYHSVGFGGYKTGDFARGYRVLGSGRDAMNSSQGGARGK